MNDLIDVLIPVYNGAPTVKLAVESIQAQSHRNLCIHIVDDGSTDGTACILLALAAADPRVRVHTKPNGGIVDALNHGLSFCTAEWVARHDADDLAYPNRFTVQLAYLKSHPDCVAVGAAVRHIDAQSVPTGTVARLHQPEQGDATWIPSREPYLIHPFLMVRRDAVECVGRYRHVHYAEDTDLYWRLLSCGRLHNLPELLGDYRMHEGSISGSSLNNGRLMSVSSQLAAISARRRAEGKLDVVFDKNRIHRLKAAKSLRGMIDAACDDLEQHERAHFKAAVSAKLLELATYRPYELERDDLVVIGKAIAGYFTLIPSALNRKGLAAMTSGTAARVAYAGRFLDALMLLSPRFVGGFAWRLASRCVVTPSLRTRLRRFVRPGEIVK